MKKTLKSLFLLLVLTGFALPTVGCGGPGSSNNIPTDDEDARDAKLDAEQRAAEEGANK